MRGLSLTGGCARPEVVAAMPRQLELGRKLPRHRGVFIQRLDRLDEPQVLVAVAAATPGGRSGPRVAPRHAVC